MRDRYNIISSRPVRNAAEVIQYNKSYVSWSLNTRAFLGLHLMQSPYEGVKIPQQQLCARSTSSTTTIWHECDSITH